MKARIIETGDIVEAAPSHSDGGKLWYEIDKSGYFLTDEQLDFCFEREPDYWEKLLHQYAGMALSRLVELVNHGYDYVYEEVAILATNYATALVEKLKESKI